MIKAFEGYMAQQILEDSEELHVAEQDMPTSSHNLKAAWKKFHLGKVHHRPIDELIVLLEEIKHCSIEKHNAEIEVVNTSIQALRDWQIKTETKVTA